MWVKVGQTFGIIGFQYLEFGGAAKKIQSKVYFLVCCITRGEQMKLMTELSFANLWHNWFFEFRIWSCQLHAFEKSKIAFLGLIKSRQKKFKSGQMWANIGQTFGVIGF